MAELNLRVNTQQAEQAAQRFQKILNDIKIAARAIDSLDFNNLAGTFNRMTSGARNFLVTIENITRAVDGMHTSLRSMASADYGTKMAAGFRNLRDTIRETRTDVSRLNTDLQTAVRAAERAPRVSRSRSGATSADTTPQMTTALTVQDNSFLRMAQERARMMAQVSAVESAARQTELQAQGQMAGQIRAFQQAKVAGVEAVARAEEMSAQQSMQARVSAELAAQAAFKQTQAIRTAQIATVQAAEDAARQREIQAQATMFAELRQLQQASVQQVIAGARAEEVAAQRSMQARIAAEQRVYEVRKAFAAMSTRLALPQQAGPSGFGESAFFASDFQRRMMGAGNAFQRLTQRQPLLLEQQAGPSGFGGTAFAGVTPENTRRIFGGFEEVNSTLKRTSSAFVETKSKKDALDKNLKDTAQNTLPGFDRALTTTIAILGYFTVRAILREITDLGKTLFETGRDFENSFALFRAGARDEVDEASRRMLVASDAAKRLGLDLKQTREDYARLSAAALGSSLEGRKIEEVFRGIASAQAVLGQNTEKGTGLIKVFTDILGKGRLQSEELVKQLGNIVPGSIRVVAESLNMTSQELSQAIARGTLTVEEVLTKLAAEFEKRYGTEAVKNIQRLGGAFNVLKSTINDLQITILNSGFGQGLIGGFNTLTQFLNEKETRVAIAQLAAFITNVLGAAFKTLIDILRVLRDNLNVVIEYFTFFASAAFIAGLAITVRSFVLLAQVISTIASSTAIGRLVVLGTLIASFVLGKTAADKFTEGLDGAIKKIEDLEEESNRLRQLQAQDTTNEPDKTRAQLEAQERLDKELRTFNQDLRNQAVNFELAAAGLDTLSLSYEGYGRVLERVRALERSDVFEQSDSADKAKKRQNVIDSFLGPEMQALALQEAAKFKQIIDRAKQQRDSAVRDFTNLQTFGDNQPLLNAAQEFERQLTPMRERMQEILFTAPPDRIDSISAAFQLWATRLQNLTREAEQARTRFKMWLDDLNGLRDLRIDELITKISLGIKNIGTTDTTTSIAALESSLGFLTVSGGNGLDNSLSRFREETERTADAAKRLAEEYKNVGTEVEKTASTAKALSKPEELARIGQISQQVGVDPRFMAALRQAENGRAGREFGVLSVNAPTFDEQARVAAQTIRANMRRFEGQGGTVMSGDRYSDEFIKFFSSRYAPLGAENDPTNLNRNHAANLMRFYQANIGATSGIAQAQTGGAERFLAQNRNAFLPQVGEGGFAGGQATQNIQKANDAVVELRIDIEKTSQAEQKLGDDTAQRFDEIRKRTEELQRMKRELSIEDTIGLGAVRATSQPDLVSQDMMLNNLSKERFGRERLIEVIRVGAQAAKEYGLTQDDVTNKTEKFYAVLERQRVASELYTNERLRQGHQIVLGMEEETQSLQDQLDVMQYEERLRGIILQQRRAQRELAQQVMTPEDRINAQRQIDQQSNLALRIQRANGALQQYIDNLYSATNLQAAFEDVAVNTFREAQNMILNFDQVLQQRANEKQAARQNDIQNRQNQLNIQASILERNLPSGVLRNEEQSARARQAQELRNEIEKLGIAAQDVGSKFTPLEKIGVFFESLTKTILENIQKILLEILIFKPLAEELKRILNDTGNATSASTGVSGGGGGWLGTLLGVIKTGISIYGGNVRGGYTTSDPAAAFTAASGGIVTLGGIRHFQGGGFMGVGTDTVPAMLTPGEIILNSAQQRNVASSMEGKGVTIQNNITIQTPNADSFRQSRRQLEDEMSQVSYAAIRRAGLNRNSNNQTW